MASGNLPTVTGVAPSTTPINSFYSQAAYVVGAQDKPIEVFAGSALTRALAWLQKHDWESLLLNTTLASVAGTATISLPTNIRKVKWLRVNSGNERSLKYIRSERYNELVKYQGTNGYPVFFNMDDVQSGNLKLFPTPDVAESLTMYYYYDLNTTGIFGTQAIPKMPAFLEDPLVARMMYYIALWRGVRTERLQMLRQDAEMALNDALIRDHHQPDEDVAIESEIVSPSSVYPITGYDDPTRWG